MREDLDILIKAQYPLVYLVTFEEERAEQAIASVAHTLRPQRRIYTWTMTHGIVEHGQPRNVTQHNSTVSQIGRAHVELQSQSTISYAVFCLKKKKESPPPPPPPPRPSRPVLHTPNI